MNAKAFSRSWKVNVTGMWCNTDIVSSHMNRRNFLTASLTSLGASFALGATKPWRISVLAGGFDGTHYLAGLRISLDPNWKTYWRVPGAGGIPPSIGVAGGNLVSYDVLYPIPRRFEDESGQSLGYKDDVVFPILLKLADPAKPTTLMFNIFLGVCETICIPASFEETVELKAGAADAAALQTVQAWAARVPVASTQPLISELHAEETGGQVVLRAALTKDIDDGFLEFLSGKTYFGQRPEFSNGQAAIRLLGPRTLADVQGQAVRLTYSAGGKALEQLMTIA
jgi:DsbC/DsbD-like thiol-disulfide interchange protein